MEEMLRLAKKWMMKVDDSGDAKDEEKALCPNDRKQLGKGFVRVLLVKELGLEEEDDDDLMSVVKSHYSEVRRLGKYALI